MGGVKPTWHNSRFNHSDRSEPDCLEYLNCREQAMLIELDRGRFSNSGRIVADPDRTAFFGDYFRIGGEPFGTGQ
jgi:hypothetical protein